MWQGNYTLFVHSFIVRNGLLKKALAELSNSTYIFSDSAKLKHFTFLDQNAAHQKKSELHTGIELIMKNNGISGLKAFKNSAFFREY